MHRRVLPFVVMLLLVPAVAQATVTVTAGDHTLLPNTAGQLIDILIVADAGEGANSMDLAVNINNDDGAGSGFPAPIISAVDLNETNNAPGTALAGSGNVLFDNGVTPSTNFSNGLDPPDIGIVVSVALNSTTVDVAIGAVTRVLATLEIDTTGIFAGVFPLNLQHAFFADMFMADIGSGFVPLTFTSSGVVGGLNQFGTPNHGSISVIVPEPSSILLGLFGISGVAVVAIRRRRRTA